MSATNPTYPVGTIAKLLLLTERRVQQLTKDGVIPKTERGRYELAPAVQGYIRFLQERTIGNQEKSPIDYHVEKARLTKIQADIAELELAKSQGLLAPIDQVERMVTKAFAVVCAAMRNVPGRVTPQLIGETDERRFKQVLMEEIDQALETLSESDLTGDEPDDIESEED